MSQHIVCVVGNPNCGKTTFFNALTGSRQRVGNWPGVTVDKKTGNFEYRNEKIELVDLPGIYSITPAASSGEDERVARDYILSVKLKRSSTLLMPRTSSATSTSRPS